MRFLVALLTFLLISGSLFAISWQEADKALSSNEKSTIFQAYDAYKHLYLKAIASNDARLKRRALKGVVASGKKLRIDVRKYEKKLSLLKPSPGPVKKKPKPKIKTIPLKVVPIQKTVVPPPKTLKRPPKKIIKPKLMPKKPAPKKERTTPKPKVKPVLPSNIRRLVDVSWKAGRLELHFDRKLSKNDINFFKLKKHGKNGHRYVFDIHAVMDKSRALKHRRIHSIRLAQNKPTMMRLVIENSTPLKIRFKRDNKTLTINPEGKVGEKSSKLPINLKKKWIVVIDAGHGGKDAGAVGVRKYKEKEVVLAIALRMASTLKARGYTVYMTRTKDKFIKLSRRTKFANKKDADLFISIHANAVPKKKRKKAYGIETYFLSPSRSKRAERVAAIENSAEIEDMNLYGKTTFLSALNSEKIVASHKLAIDLQSSMLMTMRKHYKGIKDGGVREGPFWVLVGAQMPAVLVEVGFISHPKEGVRLKNKSYQARLARGLADGVERYFAKNR